MAYRIVNAGWCGLFLYAVVVQLNDPDPVRWVIAYGLTAMFCGIAAIRGEVPERPAIAWGLVAVVFAGLNLAVGTGQSDPMGGFPHWGLLRDEVVREVGGLVLVAGWMFGLAWWTRRRGAG